MHGWMDGQIDKQTEMKADSYRQLDMEIDVKIFTKILEVNLFAIAYRLFHEDFSSIDGTSRRLKRNLHETVPSIEDKSS